MFTFDVTPDDGDTYRLVADSRDVSLWERTTKGNPTLAKLESNAAMSDLEIIAFNAAQRLGHFGGSLTDWRETCAINPLDPAALDEDKQGSADPTRTAP